ncbi:discoidin domain-containing protein [Actinoplanes oblitus]|uniref:Discoidin domain-containing protein n=1 Tax=Actinoplanes oblitus TaxID=3040509 RepID=A0ABY8W7B0_9ACTN|nr:discoidin domain-containing protein [Actinoplanes oblitus]WIM93212.1 discoidin domain-containing protein [Actinoplanes oblitus]
MTEFDSQRRGPSRADNLRLTKMPQRPPRPVPGYQPPVAPPPVVQPPAVAPPAPPPAPRRRRGWLAGLVVLLLAGGGAVAYRKQSEAAARPAPAVTTASPFPAGPEPRPSAVSRSPTGKINPDGVNLALHAACTASGIESDSWLPTFACDGDPATRWSSAFEEKQWLRADLKRRWELTTVTLKWERSYAVGYRVETSLDGKSWEKLYATAKGKGGTVKIRAKGRVARFVRMFGVKRVSRYGYSLLELEIR